MRLPQVADFHAVQHFLNAPRLFLIAETAVIQRLQQFFLNSYFCKKCLRILRQHCQTVMKKFFELVKDNGTIEKQPQTEGRNIWMMLVPVKA